MEKLTLQLPNPNPSGGPITVQAPAGVPTGSDVILNIPQFLITVIFLVGVVAAIVFILISGIQWILSGGDEKQIEGARKRLTYSIVGLIVVVASVFVVSFVFGLLGIDARPLGIPNLPRAETGFEKSLRERKQAEIERELDYNRGTRPIPSPSQGRNIPTDCID